MSNISLDIQKKSKEFLNGLKDSIDLYLLEAESANEKLVSLNEQTSLVEESLRKKKDELKEVDVEYRKKLKFISDISNELDAVYSGHEARVLSLQGKEHETLQSIKSYQQSRERITKDIEILEKTRDGLNIHEKHKQSLEGEIVLIQKQLEGLKNESSKVGNDWIEKINASKVEYEKILKDSESAKKEAEKIASDNRNLIDSLKTRETRCLEKEKNLDIIENRLREKARRTGLSDEFKV